MSVVPSGGFGPFGGFGTSGSFGPFGPSRGLGLLGVLMGV